MMRNHKGKLHVSIVAIRFFMNFITFQCFVTNELTLRMIFVPYERRWSIYSNTTNGIHIATLYYNESFWRDVEGSLYEPLVRVF
jgi:hypothetical protein